MVINDLRLKVRPVFVKVTNRIVRSIDGLHDLWNCGSWLSNRREVNVKGATFYQPTSYMVLNRIFKNVSFTPNDHFVDIGCGEGRVLAWLKAKNFPGRITGIELDTYVASVAKEWMNRHPNSRARLIEGDALQQEYDVYTIVYLFRPFNEEFFLRLIMRLEAQLTHPISLYYLTDHYSVKYLKGRPGWKLLKRQSICRIYGLFVYTCPQWYSIWTYAPQQS